MNRQHQLLPTSPEEQALARALAHTASKVLDCERPEVQQAWRSALQPLLERLEREERAESDDQAAIERALFDAGGPAAVPAPPPPPQPPSDADNNDDNISSAERVVRRLLKLFKHEGFFSWVDSPPCPSCANNNTTTTAFARSEPPTPDERADDPTLSRVEVHACSLCGAEARFPRHASALKLLQTRRGRCGEWAHAFLAALRSQGVEARHVQDREDHVWTEYWRAGGGTGDGGGGEGRWVHADCCENAHDVPDLYEKGWGKTLTFAVAVGRAGAAEVSLRYAGVSAAAAASEEGSSSGSSIKAEAQVRALRERRQGVAVREAWLLPCLDRLSRWLRRRQRAAAAASSPLSSPPLPSREARRRREAADALDLVMRAWGLHEGGGGGGGRGADGDASLLGGRTSGSAAWRAARGEDGSGGSGETAAAAAAAPSAPPPSAATTTPKPTPWAWAREAAALRDCPPLAAFSATCGRLAGGAARASADNAPAGETAAAALEGRAGGSGKWLAFLPFPSPPPSSGAAPDAAAADDAATTSNSSSRGGGHWLECRLPRAPSPARRLRSYDLVSANDAPERDPCDWTLERWSEGEEAEEEGGEGGASASAPAGAAAAAATGRVKEGRWVAADARAGELNARRHQLRSFFLPSSAPASRAWRLRVTRVAGAGGEANSVQLGGWSLYAPAAAEAEEGEEQQQQQREGSSEAAAADASLALRALLSSASASSSVPAAPSTVTILGARALRLAADGAARASLAAAGFRPLVLLPPLGGGGGGGGGDGDGGGGGEAALVADAGAEGARDRAEAALATLGILEAED